jgi:GMP synthase PP-ATPase subunit
MIDSYEGTTDLKQDTLTETIRAIPTGATNGDVKTLDEKKTYVSKGVDAGEPGSERNKAYNKFLKVLEVNGLLGDDVESLKDSTYYADSLKSNFEAKLVEKYEEKIKTDAINAVSYDTLKAEYLEMYDATVNNYKDANAFSTALSNASSSSPVIYTPYTGYVYV